MIFRLGPQEHRTPNRCRSSSYKGQSAGRRIRRGLDCRVERYCRYRKKRTHNPLRREFFVVNQIHNFFNIRTVVL